MEPPPPPPPPPPPSTAAEKDKGKQLKTVSKTSPYIVDKVPPDDSSYMKAKHVQLIDKEPKTTSLFRSALNSILKQENRPTSRKLQEKAKAQEELKRSIMEYKQFLKSCDFINSNSQWRKVQYKLKGDERCSRLEKIDQLEIFQEYVRELEKEEEEHRKIQKEEIRRVEHKNRDEFRKLMETHVADGVLTAKMHWRDYCIKVKDLPAYLAVSSNTSGSSPKDLFEDVAEELEKQLINRKPRKDIPLFNSAINSIVKQKEVGDKIDGALKTQPSSPVKYEIDSFYEQAKQAEEHTDLETTCYRYCSAMKIDDRYDDAVKDLAFELQQMGQTKEAIDLIEQHRDLIEPHQDCLDDPLLSLYKGSGRIDEYIELLQHKLKLVEEGSAFGGKRTKIARSQERKCQQERSRLLGNLAWAYMQQENYHSAEPLYREALSIEPDKNKQCNLAICLMNSGSISEAKYLLQAVTPSYEERKMHASYIKAYDSALKTLSKLGHSDSIEEHM